MYGWVYERIERIKFHDVERKINRKKRERKKIKGIKDIAYGIKFMLFFFFLFFCFSSFFLSMQNLFENFLEDYD